MVFTHWSARSRPGPRQLGRSFAAGSPPRHILREELRHPDHVPGGTSAVPGQTVESETTSTRAAKITLTAERTAENRSNLLEVGMEEGPRTTSPSSLPGSSSSANPIPSKQCRSW